MFILYWENQKFDARGAIVSFCVIIFVLATIGCIKFHKTMDWSFFNNAKN